MPRRASSGANVGQMVGIAVAIIAFLVIAGVLIKVIAGDFIGAASSTGKKNGVTSASPMSLSGYRDNATSLRGNVYQIEGKIEELLKWGGDRGRLISFEAKDSATTLPVPVLIPDEFRNVNMERGSEMQIVVRVNSDGMLVAESVHQ